MRRAVRRFVGHNITALGSANTNVVDDQLGASLTPQGDSSVFHITVVLDGGSTLIHSVSDGSNEHTGTLNSGTALTADYEYNFTINAARTTTAGVALTHDLQLGSDVAINHIVIDEIISEGGR